MLVTLVFSFMFFGASSAEEEIRVAEVRAVAAAREAQRRAEPVPPPPVEESGLRSMKGWELYTWRTTGKSDVHFAILVGTNRIKPVDMIVGKDSGRGKDLRGKGVTALKSALSKLQAGQHVFWNPRLAKAPKGITWALPAKTDIAAVQKHAKGRKLKLSVSPGK